MLKYNTKLEKVNKMSSETTTESFSQLPMRQKIAYASGQLPGSFFGSFTGQIQAFFYGYMGLRWDYIIIAQIFFAIWNFVNDPIFGVLQDRTKTKNGRYLPWIKICAPFFTIGFIILFFPPDYWRNSISGEEFQIPLLLWYMLGQMLYDTFFTIVYLAHVALMPQMTMDTNERTQIAIISSVMGLIGIAASAAFPLMYLTQPITPDMIRDFKIVVVVFGVLGLAPWYWIVKEVKERQEFIPEKDTPFWESVKCVFRNPSGRIYVIYDGISVGILNFTMGGVTFLLAYVFGQYSGRSIFDLIPYLIGPVLCFVLGLWIELKIPQKKDLKTALWYSMTMEAIGFFIAFLGVLPTVTAPLDTYQVPENLWLVSIGFSIAMLGFSGDFIYHNPMRAHTIDYDELTTGERRESVYAGVGCLLSKPMISVALAGITTILALYGLVPAEPDDPLNSGLKLAANSTWPRAIMGVGIAVFLVPAILALIGVIFWYWYPIDRKMEEEIRTKLEKLHEKKRGERLSESGSSKFTDEKLKKDKEQ
jgi:GPH family glycoside/pentoside/hexuronide:cation symporter